MSDEKDTVESQVLFERGVLTEFQFDEATPNTSGDTIIPLSTAPVVIARLVGATALHIDDVSDRVWLTGNVGWRVVTNGTGLDKAEILFKIFRNSTAGSPIYSVLDSGLAAFDDIGATSINHVDRTPITVPGQQAVSYFLTAEAPSPGSVVVVIGPITFTGAELERNRC